MKFTFLGTGTSQGVPIIGCDCVVCQSQNSKDKRLRTAGLVSKNGINIVIDAGPDFRQQMLQANVNNIHAVLITHKHNDHMIGLDDVRPFNFMHKKDIPIYGSTDVLNDIQERFPYIFKKEPYPGAPRLQLIPIKSGIPFEIEGIEVHPFEVMHGKMPVLGFRFDQLTYITDAKTISEASMQIINGSKVVIVNALRHREHHSHFNLEEALEFLAKVDCKKGYLTHISHWLGLHNDLTKDLQKNIDLAYDGLVLDV